ncbi:MAG: hypothetical protein VX777_03670 [Chlamydiota bacterium]|nr:hypothetical protein [Chlamydiota bacterium]
MKACGASQDEIDEKVKELYRKLFGYDPNEPVFVDYSKKYIHVINLAHRTEMLNIEGIPVDCSLPGIHVFKHIVLKYAQI